MIVYVVIFEKDGDLHAFYGSRKDYKEIGIEDCNFKVMNCSSELPLVETDKAIPVAAIEVVVEFMETRWDGSPFGTPVVLQYNLAAKDINQHQYIH